MLCGGSQGGVPFAVELRSILETLGLMHLTYDISYSSQLTDTLVVIFGEKNIFETVILLATKKCTKLRKIRASGPLMIIKIP